MTIKQIKKFNPDCKVEVLIPDFNGNKSSLETVLTASPDVLNHNIETCRRVFRTVRPKGDYDQSLELLKRVKQLNSKIPTKSGMMVGLGETEDEIIETMNDLRNADCDLLTIGPKFLEEMQNDFSTIDLKLSADKAKDYPVERLNLDESTFRFMLNEDPMATEKLAEGIRKFSADVRKLEELLKKLLSS